MLPPAAAALLQVHLAVVRARIVAAAGRAGRETSGVTLIAVTKSVGAQVFDHLVTLGVPDIGESRVQTAEGKAKGAPPELRWHLLGHLQTNKVRKAVRLFSSIHSVDSLRLARALQAECERADTTTTAFVEINSGEAQKSGMEPGELPGFLREVRALDRIRWTGLMTMAPVSEEPEDSRPHFALLRELRERGRELVPTLAGLSMGMSQDFEVAVEEGATHVRLGRVLFDRLAAAR